MGGRGEEFGSRCVVEGGFLWRGVVWGKGETRVCFFCFLNILDSIFFSRCSDLLYF